MAKPSTNSDLTPRANGPTQRGFTLIELLVVDMIGYPNLAQATMPDCPASYHNGACGFAFADGHSEIHKWPDPRTKPPIKRATYTSVNQANSQDVQWLWDHTTRKYH